MNTDDLLVRSGWSVAEVFRIAARRVQCVSIVLAFRTSCDQLGQFGLIQPKFRVAAIKTHEKFWEHKVGWAV